MLQVTSVAREYLHSSMWHLQGTLVAPSPQAPKVSLENFAGNLKSCKPSYTRRHCHTVTHGDTWPQGIKTHMPKVNQGCVLGSWDTEQSLALYKNVCNFLLKHPLRHLSLSWWISSDLKRVGASAVGGCKLLPGSCMARGVPKSIAVWIAVPQAPWEAGLCFCVKQHWGWTVCSAPRVRFPNLCLRVWKRKAPCVLTFALCSTQACPASWPHSRKLL